MQAEHEELERTNADIQRQIDETEVKVAERERELYQVRRDVEIQKLVNQQKSDNLEQLRAEKDAIESGQQPEVSEELRRQVEQALLHDEVLLEQLRRRKEVYGLSERTI